MDPAARPARVTVDHMLLKLGRYLRCLGLDADWDPQLTTHELIRRANAEGRVFVTRNRHLAHNYPRPLVWIGVASDDPVEQFHEVVRELDLDLTRHLFTRCVRCNEVLEEVADPRDVDASVSPVVLETYRSFFTCPHCGTLFWRGSHVRNTCRKLGLPDASEG